MRKAIVIITVAAIVSGAAYLLIRGKDERGTTDAVAVRDIGYTVAATGRVEGLREAVISSKVPGVIEYLSDEGTLAHKGDPIVRLESSELEARLEEAEYSLRQARLDRDRFRDLYRNGYASARENELAETSFGRVEAHARAIREALNDMTIRAPFDCVVVKKYMEVGETAGVTARVEPILKVADLGALRARAEVEEADIGKVAVGQRATVTSDAFPGREFSGRVESISRAVGKKTLFSGDPTEPKDVKVIEVVIGLDTTGNLKVGMTVDVRISAPVKSGVLSVSKKAVYVEGDGEYVHLERRGGTVKARVVTGARDDYYVEITGGLNEGDIVITKEEAAAR